MEFSWNSHIESVQRSLNLLFQCTLFLMFPLFQNYLNPQVRTKILVNSVAYYPCPSRLASRVASRAQDISLNSLGFYLSPECLFYFLWLAYSTMCRKKFSIYGVHIPRKWIEPMHFYSYSSPALKTPGRIFWKSVSPKTKWLEEIMISFVKIHSENMKMTCNISLFIFCKICNFYKCACVTVL